MISFAEAAKATIPNDATAMTQTWNGAPSHATTSSALVDLFYAASRNVETSRLLSLLEAAWAENQLYTLKIVAYCRDVRGGKGERKLARDMIHWIAKNAPKAITHNLDHFVGEFGRYDDVLAVLGTPAEKAGLALWADQLKKDLAALHDSETASISLAAKWIPSEGKSADKKDKVCRKLCKALGVKSLAELRKMYLSPLRKRLAILERLMCAKEWDVVRFEAVPSVAMKIHGRKGKAFERNAGERFAAYKASLSRGETKVNAKALFPHEVVAPYCKYGAKVDDLTEAQWKVMLEKGKEVGDLSDVLVMSDVSGSMAGLPMMISVSLGILVSQLTSEAWKGLVMTFAAKPQFYEVKGDTLFEQAKCLMEAPWGGNTDFQAALDLILETALKNRIGKADMPKRLIVISDMQFDCANGSGRKTNYTVLQEKYARAGYEVPHLVFWNVNGQTKDFPTTDAMPNVSLISGYSQSILKAVLNGKKLTPYTTMMNAISDERYDRITLPDA